jgi:hypothetical protein
MLVDPICEPLHCTACAQRVTLLYVPSAPANNFYQCPHCHTAIPVFVAGVVIDWWAGHEGVDVPLSGQAPERAIPSSPVNAPGH